MCFSVRHVSTANCSNSGLASLNQPSPSTWSSDVDRPVRGGRPFCETTLPTLPPWICSWSRPLASKLLYGFVIARIDRRDLVWINVTTNPTAEWIARQITEAFPWDGAPRYTIRDRDRIYGAGVTRRSRGHGHSGQTDCTGLALAEWLCRTADRIDPARVFGPQHCLGRGTSAPHSNFLCGLLQLRQN